VSAPLVLVLVVAGAYLAAHVAFDWLGRRFMVVSGAEYLLLGILLGPSVSGLIAADVLGGFAPVMTLAIGWVGAVVGAQFFVPGLARIPGVFFRIALIEAVASLAVVSATVGLVLHRFVEMPLQEVVLPAVSLGAVATASAPAGIGLIARRLGRRDPVVRQLEVATAVDAAVAILAFGLALSIVHPAPPAAPRAPTATEWAVITFAIGVVGGALFHLFFGGETKDDRLFVSLAGAVILVSGAAASLRLSPLLPAFLVGAILMNTSRSRHEIGQVLAKVERPLYFVLLVFAGAAWPAEGLSWILPVIVFLATRTVAKLAGAWLGAAVSEGLSTLGPGWGRALLGQGGLAIAIGLSYRLHDDLPVPELVFTAALVSVLLTDVTQAYFARSVVRTASPEEVI